MARAASEGLKAMGIVIQKSRGVVVVMCMNTYWG